MEGLLVLWTLIAGGYAVNEVMTENEALVQKLDDEALEAMAQNQPELKVAAYDAELDGDSVAQNK